MYRIVRKIFLICLILVCLSTCVFLALLLTPLPEWLANRIVDGFLEGPAGLDIQIGHVGGDLFHELSLEGVEVRFRDGQSRGQLQHIQLQYDWRDLVRKRWRVREAELLKPYLFWSPPKDTVFSTAAPWSSVAAEITPAIPTIDIDHLTVVDGRIENTSGVLMDSLGLQISARGWDGQLRVQIPQCHFLLPHRDLVLQDLSTDLTYSRGMVKVTQLQAETGRSRLHLLGSISVSPAFSCSLGVCADSLSLKELGLALGTRRPLRGHLVLKSQIQADERSWMGDLQLSGQVEGYHIQQLATDFRWQRGRLELADLSVKGPGIALGGQGHLVVAEEPPGFEADLVLQDVDLSKLLDQAPPSQLSGQLRVSGTGLTPQTLRAVFDLDLDPGTIAARSFQCIRGQIQLDQGCWTFDRGLELALAGTHLLLWGSLDADRRLDAWAEVKVKDIGSLLGSPELMGSLQARCRALGTMTDPVLAGQIELIGLTHGSVHVKRASGLFRLKGAVSRKEGSFSLQLADGGVGKLLVERGHARGRFASQKVFLDSVVVEGPDGQLLAVAQLDLSHEGWEIQVDSLKGTYRGYALANSSPLRLSRNGDGVHLEESRLVLEAGSIELQGSLSSDSQIQGMARLRDVELEPISHLWSQEPRLSGPVFLDVTVGGTTNEPVIQASLRWTECGFNLVNFDQVQAQMAYQQNQLTLEHFQARRGSSLLRGEGHLPVDLFRGKLLTDESWDLSFSGEGSSLEILSLLVGEVERIDGPFDLQVRAVGTPGQPRYDGFFNLRDGTLKLASLGNSIQKLTVQAHLDGQYMVLDRLEGETPFAEKNFFKRIWAKLFPSKKRGRFEAFGRINLADPAFDLTMEGHKMYVNYQEEQVEAEMDARLRVTGQKEPLISGQVDLRRCLISRPVSSPPRVVAEKKPSAYTLDLNVHIPKNCWLRNEAANIELRGLLRVLQQGGQLSLLGDLETVRGTYFFYGNNFRIQRGLVSFDELTDINPQLNVEAWTEVERERINLTIGGRLRSPTLSLTSSSGYGEGDIIALLTLHHSSAGMDTLGAEEVVRSQALGLFGSFLQEELSRKASSTLGVDKFRIKPGSGQGLGLRGAEVTLGTYLSSKIYVEYSRRLSQESGEQVGVEYSLSRNLFLLGNRNKDGLYRLGLSLKWDY